jgi:hypothetical protein
MLPKIFSVRRLIINFCISSHLYLLGNNYIYTLEFLIYLSALVEKEIIYFTRHVFVCMYLRLLR